MDLLKFLQEIQANKPNASIKDVIEIIEHEFIHIVYAKPRGKSEIIIAHCKKNNIPYINIEMSCDEKQTENT